MSDELDDFKGGMFENYVNFHPSYDAFFIFTIIDSESTR